MTVRNNYRVEFIGGPNDGEVIYQWAKPEPELDFVFTTDVEAEIHQYSIHWSNAFQGKYYYVGLK